MRFAKRALVLAAAFILPAGTAPDPLAAVAAANGHPAELRLRLSGTRSYEGRRVVETLDRAGTTFLDRRCVAEVCTGTWFDGTRTWKFGLNDVALPEDDRRAALRRTLAAIVSFAFAEPAFRAAGGVVEPAGPSAWRVSAAGGETLIVTGDRDMYQCVGERVHVLYLKSGISGFEEVDEAEVEKRYGVPPSLVPDFIALRGDPSDSLPGAPGVGPKTAAELLARHGSLEGALAGASAERPRIAAALHDSAADLRAFKEIATLQPVKLKRPPDRETDLAGGAAAARRLGLRRLAERLENASGLSEL